MKTKWMTFMRADCIVRDEEKVSSRSRFVRGCAHPDRRRAGRTTPSRGSISASTPAVWRSKPFVSSSTRVFIQATFIVGVKDENRETLKRQVALAKKIVWTSPPSIDHAGSQDAIFDDAIANGHITEEDFDNFDWIVLSSTPTT